MNSLKFHILSASFQSRMKLKLIVVFSLAFSFRAFSQNGNYSLSHFNPAQERSDYLSFDLTQDDRGIIYIAGKEGVEEFDGRRWRLIPTPGVTYTLAKTTAGIMVGGLEGFGLVINNPAKGWSYQPISEAAEAKNVFASVTLVDKSYLINDDHLFIVSSATNTTEVITKAPEGTELTGIFEINGKVLLTTSDNGLLSVDAQGKFIASDFSFPDEQILFVEKLNSTNTYLIGTAFNRLFSCGGDNIPKEIAIKDQPYLNTHIISDGVWLNDQIIAVGTLRGGVIFINTTTGSTEEIIDYNTGLPDNEVFALLSDKRQGIWVAHGYGYTRIATNIPFRSFSHYKGLNGNLLTVQSINGSLYAGTSIGLFVLTQQEVYDDEVYYVTKKVNNSKKTEEELPAEEQAAPEERQRAKRGLFGFLKKEKNKTQSQEKPATTAKEQSTAKSKPVEVTKREKRVRKVLRSLDFSYKKIDGIEGKVTQLWNWKGKLLAAGPSGLYEVIREQARVVSEDPIRSFTITKDEMTLVAATYDDEVKTFSSNGDEWNRTSLLDTLHTFVSFLFEDKQQNIWLCGLNAIYKAEIAEGEVVDVVKIPFSNPTMAETFGMAAGSDVLVMIAGKFFRFDFGKEKFTLYDSLSSAGKSLVSGNMFWYFDGHNWKTSDQKLKQKFKLEWLNLFPELRFISPDDKNENIWVITSSNELYRFSGDAGVVDSYQYPLFLKDVRNPQAKLRYTDQKVVLSQELGAVTFEFIQPEYSGLHTTEYRYWVQGLQQKWSEWSAVNNEITFPFLPVGTYKVLIEAKNLFGEIAETPPVNFVVVPPYWKQAWFYAAEVAFFSMLVVLSIRLSAMNERYRVVSRLLSLLTVIMLIQLIQSAAYSLINIKSSPVMDFFIQVSIALLVLPLESTLRKFMTKAADGKFTLGKLVGGRTE